MTVTNQLPYQSFTANGVQVNFAFNFYVEDKANIEVFVEDTLISKNEYSYNSNVNSIVFNQAPLNGATVEIKRVTTIEREIQYATYNNSFRPETLNHDLDRIIRILQELGYTDLVLLNKISKEIIDRTEAIKDLQDQILLEIATRSESDKELQDHIKNNTLDIAGLVTSLKQEQVKRINGDIEVAQSARAYTDFMLRMNNSTNIFDGIADNIVTTRTGESQRQLNNKTTYFVDSVSDLNSIVNPLNGQFVLVKENGQYQYAEETTEWVAVKQYTNTINDQSGLSLLELSKGLDSIADLENIVLPYDGQRVYVKSFYKDLNEGGGEFVFKDKVSPTLKVGFIIPSSTGAWYRVAKTSHSIADAGAHPTQSRTVNTLAINTVLEMSKDVFVPTATYQISPTGMYLNTGNYLHGKGVFVGDAPETIAADGTGVYLVGGSVNNVKIEGITLKNGYRGTGIIFYDAKDITIRDVTVDGFTYGITLREKNFQEADTNGVQNALLENVTIKNTRYWGIYLRCYGTVTESKKTQHIRISNPYFYNCHMAGYVEAEGNVRYTVLENPVFERCNVCMHYEISSDFTIINPRTIDTGKKSDQLQANTEYPFVNWSLYICFAQRGQLIGGNLDRAVSLLAGGSTSKVSDISFEGVNAHEYIFEGVGTDTNKDYFTNISWNGGSVTGALVYHQPSDAASSYLKNIAIKNVHSKMNGNNNGNYISINTKRCINLSVENCTFTNSAIKVAVTGICKIVNNTWTVGTDNTNNSYNGTAGDLSGNFLEYTGNLFARCGGVVYGHAANTIENWTRVRIDNVVRGNSVNYAYALINNNRIEHGGGMVYDINIGNYTETGTTNFIKLYSTT